MLALHQVLGVLSHVVAQIVEAELVVGAEGDVGQVSLAALGAVGAVLVDAVDAQSVEHVDGTHPLRVTLGQVIVHRDHMHAVACERVEEHGQRGGECLSLAREHLGYLSLVQDDSSEQLHVKVHHVPLHVIAPGHPMVVVDGLVTIDVHKVVAGGQFAVEIVGGDHHFLVVREARRSALHNGEHLGESLVKCLLQRVEHILLQFVYLLEYGCAVLDGRALDAVLQLLDLPAQGGGTFQYALLYFLHTCAQLVVGEGLHGRIGLDDLLHQGLVCLQVTRLLVAEYLGQYAYKIHLVCIGLYFIYNV